MKYLSTLVISSRSIISSLFIILMAGVLVVSAAAPSGGYLPGGTLDPDCTPGATDCIVKKTAIPTGGMSGQLLTHNELGELAWTTPTSLSWGLLGNAETNTSINFIGTTDNQDLVFRTNNNERARILANGNVGIGAWNPQYPLHVYGQGSGLFGRTFLAVQNSQANSAAGIIIGNGDGRSAAIQYSGSDYIIGEVLNIYTNSDKNIQFSTNSTWSSGGSSFVSFSPGGYANESVRFLGNGNVLVGTTIDSGYKLDVSGNINASGSVHAAGVALTSDLRYKKDITPITSSLEMITRLYPVSYKWNELGVSRGGKKDTLQYGLIAQELEVSIPDLVETDGQGYKSVNYIGLTPILIEAIKELNIKIDTTALSVGHNPSVSFFETLKNWLSNINNGIEKIFAKEIQTKNICLIDDFGSKTCLTKLQIDKLLEISNLNSKNSLGDVVDNYSSVPTDMEIIQ